MITIAYLISLDAFIELQGDVPGTRINNVVFGGINFGPAIILGAL